MNCTCTETKQIASCLINLVIGSITPTDTDVYVYIKRLGAAERTERADATTDSNGDITADLSGLPEGFLSDNFDYELWVTQQSNDVTENETITLEDNATSDTCFCVM